MKSCFVWQNVNEVWLTGIIPISYFANMYSRNIHFISWVKEIYTYNVLTKICKIQGIYNIFFQKIYYWNRWLKFKKMCPQQLFLIKLGKEVVMNWKKNDYRHILFTVFGVFYSMKLTKFIDILSKYKNFKNFCTSMDF